ncbi:unnamed protein product, partial [Sphacelaria rigidula]
MRQLRMKCCQCERDCVGHMMVVEIFGALMQLMFWGALQRSREVFLFISQRGSKNGWVWMWKRAHSCSSVSWLIMYKDRRDLLGAPSYRARRQHWRASSVGSASWAIVFVKN